MMQHKSYVVSNRDACLSGSSIAIGAGALIVARNFFGSIFLTRFTGIFHSHM